MRIKAKYNNQEHISYNEPLVYVFKRDEKELIIDLEVVGFFEKPLYGHKEDFEWLIEENNIQVDKEDSTTGLKAQLILYPFQAGSINRPTKYYIEVFTQKKVSVAHKTILLSALPTISNVEWVDEQDLATDEIDLNTSVFLKINTRGFYNERIHYKIYNQDNKLLLTSKYIDGNIKYYKKEYIYYSNLEGNSIFPSFLENDTKIYVVIFFGKDILYNGSDENNFLKIIKLSEKNETPRVELEQIVVVGEREEYFTQEYEPCFYSKIEVKEDDKEPVTLFDEKTPKSTLNTGDLIFNIRGKSENNPKKLTILVDADTNKCQNLSVENSDEKRTNRVTRIHKDSVFDYDRENEAFKEVDANKKLKIDVYYDYEYTGDKEYFEFLMRYFIFSTFLPSEIPYGTIPIARSFINKGLKNTKPLLLAKEIDRKNFPVSHTIKIDTCRYRNDLEINIVPDLAWAFHFDYGDVNVGDLVHYKDKQVDRVKGLDKEFEELENVVFLVSKYTRYLPGNWIIDTSVVNLIILEILKKMASNFSVAFTAYYDFEGDTPTETKEYHKKFPSIAKGFIGGALAVNILFEIALCVLTEGVSTAKYLSAINKVKGVKLTGKAKELAEKGDRISTSQGLAVTGANKVYDRLEALTFSYFKGYEFLSETNRLPDLQIEERFRFILVKFVEKIGTITLGEMLLNKTKLGSGLNMSIDFLDTVLSVQANLNFFNESYSYATGNNNALGEDLISYPITLMKRGVESVKKYAIVATDKMIKEVFNTEASFEMEYEGNISIDYHIKANNATKTFEMVDFIKGSNQKHANEVSIAPEGGLYINTKLEAKTTVHVKAMRLLHIDGEKDEKGKDVAEGGTIDLKSGIKWARKYIFKSDETKPYYQDIVVFHGLGGEYSLINNNKDKGNLDNRKEDEKPKKFIIIEAKKITLKPQPIF